MARAQVAGTLQFAYAIGCFLVSFRMALRSKEWPFPLAQAATIPAHPYIWTDAYVGDCGIALVMFSILTAIWNMTFLSWQISRLS